MERDMEADAKKTHGMDRGADRDRLEKVKKELDGEREGVFHLLFGVFVWFVIH